MYKSIECSQTPIGLILEVNDKYIFTLISVKLMVIKLLMSIRDSLCPITFLVVIGIVLKIVELN